MVKRVNLRCCQGQEEVVGEWTQPGSGWHCWAVIGAVLYRHPDDWPLPIAVPIPSTRADFLRGLRVSRAHDQGFYESTEGSEHN